MLLISLGILLSIVFAAENISILRERKGLRIIIGCLHAGAGICYALWARADVFAWDVPTRLALAGCLFPVLTALENYLPRYKKMLVWGLGAIYLILLLLTALKA